MQPLFLQFSIRGARVRRPHSQLVKGTNWNLVLVQPVDRLLFHYVGPASPNTNFTTSASMKEKIDHGLVWFVVNAGLVEVSPRLVAFFFTPLSMDWLNRGTAKIAGPFS